MKTIQPGYWLRLAQTTALLTFFSFLSCMGADLETLFSGQTHPLTVKLSDLNAEWRRFTIHTFGNASGNISVSITGSGGNSGSSQNNISDLTGSRSYLTKGQTVSAHGQVYLVAYRIPGSGLDFSGLLQALATKTPPTPTILTAESTLPLSLLDLKSLGNLDEIRAFDRNREITESEKLARTLEAALKAMNPGPTNNAPRPAATPGK